MRLKEGGRYWSLQSRCQCQSTWTLAQGLAPLLAHTFSSAGSQGGTPLRQQAPNSLTKPRADTPGDPGGPWTRSIFRQEAL